MNYSYDPLGRMTEADYRHGTGLNGDQSLQTPLSLSDVNTLDSRVAYDMNGRIAGKRSGGVSSGDSAAYVYYDDSYRVERVTGKPSGSSLRDASATGNFRYDEAGNMVHDASKALSITYNYDGMPREFMVVETPSVTMHQLYDVGGQRVTQIVAAGGALTFWVGAGNDGAAPYDFSTVGQAMTSLQTLLATRAGRAPDSVIIFVVAEEGSEIYPGVSEMSLVTMNTDTVRVVIHGMQKHSSQHVAFSRNQVGRSLRAQHWVNVGGQVMSEVREVYDTTGALIDRRVVANVYGRGTPIGRSVVDSGQIQFYVKNHLGSTVRVVNADGSYATSPVFDYQAYGELQGIREDSANPVSAKFTGKELDTTVNLSYFGARWYDAELGIWLAVDPVNDGFNPYGYVGGNPLSYIDPFGMKKCKGFGCVGSFFIDVWQKTSNTTERANNYFANDNCTWETNDRCRDKWTNRIESSGGVEQLEEACGAAGDQQACQTLDLIAGGGPWGMDSPMSRRLAYLIVSNGQHSYGIKYTSGSGASAMTLQYDDITIPVYYDNHEPEISRPSRDVGGRSGADNRAVVRSRPVEGTPLGNHAFIELQTFQNGEWVTSTTLSSFKEGPFLDGYLNTRLGGDLNHISGSTADFTIYGANDVLLQRFNSFRNNTVRYRTASPYGGYNSNGFINGLLRSSGFRYYSPNTWAPYHDKPVPVNFFY